MTVCDRCEDPKAKGVSKVVCVNYAGESTVLSNLELCKSCWGEFQALCEEFLIGDTK